MAFDIDTNDSILVDGNSGESFACLVGAKRTLFVPLVIVRQEVLEPCRADTRRTPGEYKFPQDPMKTCLQGRKSALVAFVDGEK